MIVIISLLGMAACGQSATTSGSSGSALSGGSSIAASTIQGNTALVFSGSGACPENCANAGGTAAQLAGLTPKYVTGNEINSSSTPAQIAAFFQGVRVWIMPGGVSNTEINSMSQTMKDALVKFVAAGGGYVGWCAGAFASTSQIGTTGQAGLGLMPGSTTLYSSNQPTDSYGGSIETLKWNGATHYFYLEGGPYLSNLGSQAEAIATYSNGQVAAARAAYGSGRVFVSGVHPEAPTYWWQGSSINDPDGSDVAYAADMIKWAASLE